MEEREIQREQVYLKADSLAGGALFNTIRAAGTNGSMRPLGPNIQTCHAIPWVGEWAWERQARCGQLLLTGIGRAMRRSHRPDDVSLACGTLELRSTEPIALHQADSEIRKAVRLIAGLYAFGNYIDGQLLAHGNHAGHDRAT